MKIHRLLFCILILLSVKSIAQQFPYSHYTLESESAIYDIIQDHKGFIWLATGRGVYRFDGYSFHNYSVNEGLTDNLVFNIYEDRFGRIWFNTNNNALCYYENDRIIKYAHNNSLVKYVGKQRLRTFDVAPDSSLLLGYYSVGILRISPQGKISHPPGDLMNESTFTVIDGGSWGGFSAGLKTPNDSIRIFCYEFNDVPMAFQYHLEKSKGGTERPLALRRHNGNCCFYTGKLFIEVSPKNDPVIISMPEESIRIYEDNDSCLWISTFSGGVTRYAPNAVPWEGTGQKYFSSWSISGILQDREGGFWLTTFDNGLYYVPSLAVEYVIGGQEDRVPAFNITGTPSKLYVETEKEIAVRYGNGPWQNLNVPAKKKSSTCVFFRYDTLHQQLLLGFTNAGFFSLNDKGKLAAGSSFYPNHVTIAGDSFFLTNSEGVYRIVQDHLSLSGTVTKNMKDLRISQQANCWCYNHLWMASKNGFGFIDSAGFHLASPGDSLLKLKPAGLCALGDKKVAIAVPERGIIIYDPRTKRSFMIDKKKGLEKSFLELLYPVSENSFWVFTESGISSIDLAGDTECIVRNYSRVLFSTTGKIKDFFIRGQEIWLATNSGLLRLLPGEIKKNLSPPPVYITSVQVNDSLFPFSASCIVSHKMNAFHFSFVGLAYHLHGKVKYHYCLDGLSNDTVNTFSPEALFLSLPPGKYNFRVWAENEEGAWSAAPAEFSFTILPPFWQTGWFIMLAILVVISILAFLLFRIRRGNKLRENLLEYQQQALVSQMNPHFIFNSLNTIQSYIFREDKENALHYLSRFSKLIRMSLDHSRLKMVPLQQELLLVRVYLELESMRFPERMSWSVEISETLENSGIEVPSLLIQPYLENAIRHGIMNRAGAGGKVFLKIEKEKSLLLCTIEDNGVGRAEAARLKKDAKHFSAGTSITEARLKLICRSLNCMFFMGVKDRLDDHGNVAGTIVKFGLPYRAV